MGEATPAPSAEHDRQTARSSSRGEYVAVPGRDSLADDAYGTGGKRRDFPAPAVTNETRNMIGIDELRKMKRTAILINTARAGWWMSKPLAQALKQGLIAGAGFDVLSKEPPKEGNPLLELRLPTSF